MTTISIYTDGASSGNPGPGGYAAVIVDGKHRSEISGGFRLTTNNRMELYAAIAGLEALDSRQPVCIYSDSQYLVESLNQGWVQIWKTRRWRKTKKEKVLNVDLWQRLLALLEKRRVTFEWLEGHAGHPLNERANRLAQQALLAPNLPADQGYEQAGASEGEIQAGLFDVADENANPETNESKGSNSRQSLGSSRKVTSAGQACRKCGTPVVKRTPARKLKPGQNFYYEYYFQCPKCGTIYLVDQAKRSVEK